MINVHIDSKPVNLGELYDLVESRLGTEWDPAWPILRGIGFDEALEWVLHVLEVMRAKDADG